MSFRSITKRGVALFSEVIWIYFGLALYANIEWQITKLLDPIVFIFASFSGFILQWGLRNWITHDAVLYGISVVVLFSQLVWNWGTLASSGYGYALLVSAATFFLFIRSGFLAYHEPRRTQMILRFEGNIIWYIVFVLSMKANPVVESVIHFPFILSILLCLAGIVLTLHPEEMDADGSIQVRMAGGTGKLPGLFVGILILGGVMSPWILLPQIQAGVISALSKVGDYTIWLGKVIFHFLTWILSLIPVSDEPIGLIPAPANQSVDMDDGTMLSSLPIPTFWLILFLLLIVIIIALWLLIRLMPKRLTHRKNRPITLAQTQDSFWRHIWLRWKTFLQQLILNWKMRYPGFYAFRIYWYFQLLQQWGRKHGLERLPTETPQDYSSRIVQHDIIPESIHYQGKDYNLRIAVVELGNGFAKTYYSAGRQDHEYDFTPLLWYLRKRA